MSEETQDLRRDNWMACCGIRNLFRAFRMAITPTMLILAFCGVFLTYATGRVLDRVWPAGSLPVRVAVTEGAAQTELDVFLKAEGGGRRAAKDWLAADKPGDVSHVGAFELLLAHGGSAIRATTGAVLRLDPAGICRAGRHGAMGVVWLVAMHPVYAVIFFVISLLIWAYLGGALCRAAALDATREEKAGLGECLAFAGKKFASFAAAPLMPVGVLVLLAIPLYVGGWVGAIPWVGDILVGVLFFLALLAGLAMAFVAIGGVAGGSLMFPTIAVEGSDAFDAFSRSFSYVYGRPWRAAFYGVVSVVYGAICVLFVKFFVRLMLWLVHTVVGWSMNVGNASVATEGGAAGVGKLDAIWQGPSLSGGSSFWGGFGEVDVTGASQIGQCFFYLWIFGMVGLVGAFIVSFYYSASTLTYLLLRRDVDATDMEDVCIEEHPVEEQPVGESASSVAPSAAPPEPTGSPESTAAGDQEAGGSTSQSEDEQPT